MCRGWINFGRILAVSAVVLFFSAAPKAQAAKGGDMNAAATEAYGKAREAREAGDMLGSLRWLQEAYKRDAQPLLLYNIARVYETIGNYKKAYESYLRLQATPGVSDKLSNLAGFRSGEIKPRLKKGIFMVKNAPSGGAVFLDGAVQRDLSEELISEPGEHLLLVMDKAGEKGWLFKLRLKGGIRQEVDTRAKDRKWGALTWKAGTGAESLEVDGQLLPVDLEALVLLRVGAGIHHVKAVMASGAAVEVAVMVGAKKKVSLADKLKAGGTAKVSPAVASSEPQTVSAVSEAPRGKLDPGVWPWVVVGAGTAVLGGGVYMFVSAQSDWDEARTIKEAWKNYNGQLARGKDVERPGSTQRQAVDFEESGNRGASLGAVMSVLGVAALGGGVAWWLMADRGAGAGHGEAEAKPIFWVAPAPGGLWTFGVHY